MIDQVEDWPCLSKRVIHRGRIVTFEERRVATPSGEVVTRELIAHPGSVAIMALDDDDRIAVVHQYRVPLGMRLVEPPAGLLDVTGEAPLAAAQRELAEEAGLSADSWHVLADYCTSPGISNEVARIFLARGLHQVARPASFTASGEEVDMGLVWLPLDDALQQVRSGLLHNGALVLGVTTLCLARLDGSIDGLLDGDAPWPQRDHILKQRDDG